MPTLTKEADGQIVRVTTEVPRELVTLRSQGFKEELAAEVTLSELTVKELRKELSDRGLLTKGSKDELVARLAEQPLPPIASDRDSTGADSASTTEPTPVPAQTPSTTVEQATAADSTDQ